MSRLPMTHLRFLLFWSATCGAALAADGWINLFNGKNLDNWVVRGGTAKFTIDEDGIVGTAAPNTPNTFLCTPRDYGDFILEYDFKVDPRLNSGVQFRSDCLPNITKFTWQGKEIRVSENIGHGYPVAIDNDPHRDRWWSGGVYDEFARGWLYPGALGGDGDAFTKQGRDITRQGDWNHIRLECIGSSIKTFMNLTPCADLKDSRITTGLIGLQVHNISGKPDMVGAQVHFRKIRIQELEDNGDVNALSKEEQAAGWSLLWDGKTGNGWRGIDSMIFPSKGWECKEGMLCSTRNTGNEAAVSNDIITCDKYSDFELRLEFKLTKDANSGIKIFVDPELNKGQGGGIGMEYQIIDDVGHPEVKTDAGGSHSLASLYDLIAAPVDKVVHPLGSWNRARILSRGKKVTFWLNDVRTVSFERGSEAWRELVKNSKFKDCPGFGELADGHILLQEHGGLVSYRNIKIRVPHEN